MSGALQPLLPTPMIHIELSYPQCTQRKWGLLKASGLAGSHISDRAEIQAQVYLPDTGSCCYHRPLNTMWRWGRWGVDGLSLWDSRQC